MLGEHVDGSTRTMREKAPAIGRRLGEVIKVGEPHRDHPDRPSSAVRSAA
jgi:hypothetical protein